MQPAPLLGALLALTMLSGCLGGDDASTQGVPTTSGTDTDSSTGGPGNGTGNPTYGNGSTNGTSTGNGTGDGAAEWMYDNRTGTVSGTAIVLMPPPSKEESFTVSQATKLELMLNATGDELTLTVRPPGCTSEDCEETATTQGGQASLAFDAPDGGDWSATLAVEGLGPVSAEYELSIGQLVPEP